MVGAPRVSRFGMCIIIEGADRVDAASGISRCIRSAISLVATMLRASMGLRDSVDAACLGAVVLSDGAAGARVS